jgi:trehalose synthase
MTMFDVEVSSMSPERFSSVLTAEQYAALEQGIARGNDVLRERVVWNVNSTARGGGVAELLESLVAYARGAGVDVRWCVLEGDTEFFSVTKRVHNRLHGAAGDGGPLGAHESAVFERTTAANLPELAERVRPGDLVIIHDPQPAGLIAPLKAAGAGVIWRCHVGIDHPNDSAREAWRFLHPFIADADAYVFSRESFVWENLDRSRIAVIAPSIDVFSPKNQDLDADAVIGILHATRILADGGERPASFRRQDGTPGRVDRRTELAEDQPLESLTPIVVQVSRWDSLKDPLGVIRGFAEHVPDSSGAHLLYAGPETAAVTDDPEGIRVLSEALALRANLPDAIRRRIHLASLPMADPEENAIIVNALQRHAAVIAQKSLAEGFGLTVAEAMWKARPVVASRIGGIQSQIVDGESGVLLDDPLDLGAFGAAITDLLLEPQRAAQIGASARERVRDEFTSPRSLLDYLDLICKVIERLEVSPTAV